MWLVSTVRRSCLSVIVASLFGALLAISPVAGIEPEPSPSGDPPSARFVRAVPAADLGLEAVTGLAPTALGAELIGTGPATDGAVAASVFDFGRGQLARRSLPVVATAAATVAADTARGTLVVLSEGRRIELSHPTAGPVAVVADDDGPSMIDPVAATLDQRGTWYVLDRSTRTIVATRADGSVTSIALDAEGPGQVVGLAHDPATDRLHVMSGSGQRLVVVDSSGRVVSSIDLGALGLSQGGPIVFAPSSDRTDRPDVMSLYVADGDRVVEASLAGAVAVDRSVTTSEASQVRTYDLSQLSPPSPDPTGLAWMADRGRLMISDSEVDETPLYAGRNLFRLDLATGGVPAGGTNTRAYSDEPTGVAYDPSNGHLFVTDDDKEEVFEVDPGADDVHGTADDLVTQFDMLGVGSTDAEDIAFANGELYVVDGIDREVYVIGPGVNGVFDGQPGAGGDDTVSQFDIGGFGPVDPEGITYRASSDTLLVIDHRTDAIYETTLDGDLVGTIDLLGLSMTRPAAIAVAPASAGGAEHLYVADLGVDNDVDPDENDGRVLELREDAGPAPILLCEGERATVAGSSASESLVGTAGRDVIVARGGDDFIDGRGGNDVICGGGGDDTIIGGRGADQIFGQGGNDTVDASIGKDFVVGGAGDDVLRGGLGRDVVWGGGGVDECWGERMRCEVKHRTLHSGEELFFCQGVRATIVGTDGRDVLKGTRGDDVIVALAGRDTIDAGRGDDLVCAGAGRDDVRGGRGADSIYTEAGRDTANGGRGKDFVQGGGGDDELRGGLGRDTVWGLGGTDECWGEQMRCEVKHRTFHDGQPR